MYTEAVDEVVAAPPPPPCHNKGKRTKRYRPHSPINPFTVVTPPAGEHDTTTTDHRLSPAFSDESTTTEEEDTARCLILLARGGHFRNHDSKRKRHAETAAAAPDKDGACLYACKTCNRVFHSFQALGGHRASHKKPKNEKKSVVFSDEEDFPSPLLSSKKRMSPSSLQLATITAATAGKPPFPSPRMHECSYCGAEFTSGQALGGHMRRHRAGPISPLSYPAAASIEEPEPEQEPEEQKKPRNNGLSLDLNLPAPEDENQRFGKLVLSNTNTNTTPTLVDCHY